MLRKALALGLLTLVASYACTDTGKLKNPFAPEPPFVATAVPDDFVVIIDENHDTYYARQHIRQEITAAAARSITQYTTFRDYNDTVSKQFSQETPLSRVQLQNMWNAVARYDLLNRSTLWVNWLSGADLYKRNATTVQIRANGQTRSYRQTNGFPGALRPLMFELNAVRLPISQESTTPVIDNRSVPATEPTTEPASKSTEKETTDFFGPDYDKPTGLPTTQPATEPTTQEQREDDLHGRYFDGVTPPYTH
ncbi:MAG: hypothetical protein FWD61_17915 [Phycisphaerales bacterium]|nr:hypothetical protein [Phycisphaerales bacterium]